VAKGTVAIQLFQLPSKPGGVTNITYAYGDKAVYTRTNGLVTLTGNPRLETATLKATAEDALYYSVTEGRLTASGRYRVALKGDLLKQSGFGLRSTNRPAAKPPAEGAR
jgi:lipopolysaccharide export system protein LptA